MGWKFITFSFSLLATQKRLYYLSQKEFLKIRIESNRYISDDDIEN